MGSGAGKRTNTSEDAANSTGKIGDLYDVERKAKLGEGADGTVCKARSKATGIECAVKIVANSSLTVKHQEEIDIMKKMNHPSIIKLHENFKDWRHTYIVMELCSGGELFDRVMGNGACQEGHVATVMQQIIPAVGYMHERQVCHRDLKPENLLLMNQGPFESNQVKIIDFGLAKQYDVGQVLTTMVGSAYYVAPQVLAGRYNHLSDLWSCGVIMYVMLCGIPPFTGETDDEVLQKVRLGQFNFDAQAWQNVSEDARSVVRCFLKMKPSERASVEQAMAHKWFTGTA